MDVNGGRRSAWGPDTDSAPRRKTRSGTTCPNGTGRFQRSAEPGRRTASNGPRAVRSESRWGHAGVLRRGGDERRGTSPLVADRPGRGSTRGQIDFVPDRPGGRIDIVANRRRDHRPRLAASARVPAGRGDADHPRTIRITARPRWPESDDQSCSYRLAGTR